MNKIKIFTDSTSDLSQELIDKYNISLIPLCVNFADGLYHDGVDITTGELFDKVNETGRLPVTSAPSPEKYYYEFKPWIDKGYKIIYIGLSSRLSSTLQNAVLASERFEEGKIEVVDSLNLSTGIGLLVMKAVDFVNKNMEFSEIVNNIKELVPEVETEFVINTLKYLHKGGRCSGLERFLGSVFRIRPVVRVEDGKMGLAEKIRGRKRRAVNCLLKRAINKIGDKTLDRMFITHSRDQEGALYLKEKLGEKIDVGEIIITDAGCVISSHCGPGTVGILYINQVSEN